MAARVRELKETLGGESMCEEMEKIYSEGVLRDAPKDFVRQQPRCLQMACLWKKFQLIQA